MLVIGSPFGMLANRLWRLAHFTAFSLAHTVRVVDPWFEEYRHYFAVEHSFPASVRLGGPLYRAITSTNQKLLRGPWVSGPLHHNWFATEEINMDEPSFIEAAQNKFGICYGFRFRARNSFQLFAGEIRKAFAPDRKIVADVERHISQMRKSYPDAAVVGIHIRKGDYALWRGGAYLFSDEKYSEWCRLIKARFSEVGRDVVFMVCSNRPVDVHLFHGLHTVFNSGSEIFDLYSLARCDSIMGPPSTYTMWASFYGETPLFHCHQSSDAPTLADFCPLMDDYFLP